MGGAAVAPEEMPRFEIVNHGDGRTELTSLFWGAEGSLRPEQAPDPGGGWTYCVPFADPALQLAFVRHFKGRGVPVACGTYAPLAAAHTALVREAADLADAFFCNEAEAEVLFGSVDGARTASGRLLFITRGASGARVIQGAHRTDLGGLPARELDPTGAGDTFCGTVLARLAQGEHPVEAARRAIAQATETIEDVGPRALLRERPAPEPPEDSRVALDADRLGRVAAAAREEPRAPGVRLRGRPLSAGGPPARPRLLLRGHAAAVRLLVTCGRALGRRPWWRPSVGAC